jgi:predicted benzoate:H+ symporter BenE
MMSAFREGRGPVARNRESVREDFVSTLFLVGALLDLTVFFAVVFLAIANLPAVAKMKSAEYRAADKEFQSGNIISFYQGFAISIFRNR